MLRAKACSPSVQPAGVAWLDACRAGLCGMEARFSRFAARNRPKNNVPGQENSSPGPVVFASRPEEGAAVLEVHDLFRKPVPTFRDHALDLDALQQLGQVLARVEHARLH